MLDGGDLNRRLAEGSEGSSWTPRITENQLEAIRSAVGSGARSIDPARLRAYVESGDLEALARVVDPDDFDPLPDGWGPGDPDATLT